MKLCKAVCGHCISCHMDKDGTRWRWNDADVKSWNRGEVMCPHLRSTEYPLSPQGPVPAECPYLFEHSLAFALGKELNPRCIFQSVGTRRYWGPVDIERQK
jgi:hypothetical protein